MKETIIKCIDCGFKYYEGDVHKCNAFKDSQFVGVVNVETKETEDIKAEKETTKTRKKPLKLTW